MKALGLAIDIGTTTVVLHLVDMETSEKLATVSRVNAQSPYGTDVTTRIRYCMQNGHEPLTQLIREQITSMIEDAFSLARQGDGSSVFSSPCVEHITIAANTIMQHLIAGYSPVAMGVTPFTPISLFGEELPAWEGLPIAKDSKIYYTPAISAYVGGDITAGLLAAGFEDISDPAIFLDIGTNGEIVLKYNGIYYCCATAAGPAFEGSEIELGMAAENGAVDHVWLGEEATRQGDGSSVLKLLSLKMRESKPDRTDEPSPCLAYSTIGNTTPKGICGSGLLDTLAVLLDIGEVDETGRLLSNDKFWIDEKLDIYITAEDIRKLQLAKAAIAAGIQVLLHFAGITESDIKLLVLAGGFGSYMDLQSAARIGLFPRSLLPVAKSYGNTAGEGAVLALTSEEARVKLESIREQCEYIELSSIAFFNDRFVEEMSFEGCQRDGSPDNICGNFTIVCQENRPPDIPLAQIAKECGFTHYTPLDISTLEFKQEIRDMCNPQQCNKYNKSWSCPPACLSLEEIRMLVKNYTTGILVQTVSIIEDSLDWDGIMEAGARHKDNFGQMKTILNEKHPSVFAMGAGECKVCDECTYPNNPCRFPEKMEISMEACGLFVSKVCADNDLKYNYGSETIAFTSCFLI